MSINSVLEFFLLVFSSEFSSQLPHDGGAFYTNDTMESSRPHYVRSWPPILHAATLWLNAGTPKTSQFENNTNNDNMVNNNSSDNSNKFHLLFGKFLSFDRKNQGGNL